jgi:hypothetical protein
MLFYNQLQKLENNPKSPYEWITKGKSLLGLGLLPDLVTQ